MAESFERRNESWLGPLERPALTWLAARAPAWISPDGMTAIGFAGAILALGSYALSARNPAWLFLASFGFLLNWLGDSLDGSLARYRKIERPIYGYFLDNNVDMFEQLIITIGAGLSGYVGWGLCFCALSMILMFSGLTLIRTVSSGVQKITYGGLGLTELRILGVGINTLVFFLPPEKVGWWSLPMTYPNVILLVFNIVCLALITSSFIGQLKEVALEDPARR